MDALLKQYKLKKTVPRELLLELLNNTHDPLSVDEAFSMLSKKHKNSKIPDRVTVYRTLETFKKHGIVRESVFRDKVARYELAGEHGEHCHHAVCNSCGATEHVEDPEIEKALALLSKKFKNVRYISDHALEFFGLCKKCHAK